jgi:hypothetical protein
MARHGDTRGFSRADALVLAAACLLLVVLVPMLFAKPRERASRVLCGANLGRIGKTMLIYANDYDGVLPRPGGPTSMWGPVANWVAPNRYQAYAVNPSTNEGGTASISSCFYLLVKYYQAPTRLFICKGDVGAREFRLADVPPGVFPQCTQFSDLWDFGPTMGEATRACSYTYHVPFGLYGLTTARDPNSPVAADRNPYLAGPGYVPLAGAYLFRPDIAPYLGTSDQARNGNAVTHQMDGQNVLFLDGRVTFERRAYCGVVSNDGILGLLDNIYTLTDRPPRGSAYGTEPVCSTQPTCQDDSLLLHDDPRHIGGSTPSRRL